MPTQPKVSSTVKQINDLSSQFEQAYQSLSDKYTQLSNSAGATSASLQSNNIQTQQAVSAAQDVADSSSKTRDLAIGALAVVILVALIFWFKK